jgi:hypothetical protein
MEIWGYCESCDRWFYCPTDSDTAPACPVCTQEPLRTEQRAVDSGAPLTA